MGNLAGDLALHSCVCEMLSAPGGSASRMNADRLQHGEAGWVVITTSDQMIYTVEVNYQIISKINTVAPFTAAGTHRKSGF